MRRCCNVPVRQGRALHFPFLSRPSSSLSFVSMPPLRHKNNYNYNCNGFSSAAVRTGRQGHAVVLRNAQRAAAFSTSLSTNHEFQLAHRLDGLDRPTVWQEFSPLSVEYGSINLGQGFPDWDPPPFCAEAMHQSVLSTRDGGRGANDYARSHAHLPLARVLAEEYTTKWGISVDAETQVATAVGCTNALYSALQGLLNPGDEVLLMEPAFDIYMAQVQITGARPVYVPLRLTAETTTTTTATTETLRTANEAFAVDWDELEAALSDKTRVLIFNTPHNPTGKVFSREEMECLADIVHRHPRLVVIADEVYEHIVFDKEKSPHISFATLPGMFERTLTLSSSGKTFSATGWKVGWAVGPPHLVRAITSVQQWANYSEPTPNQDAIAQCLQVARQPFGEFDSYYDYLAAEYLRKRDLLTHALQVAQLSPIVPLGSFFILADTRRVDFCQTANEEVTAAMPTNPMPRDWAMSRWMTKEVGVTAIPPSAFYDVAHVHLAKDMMRFAFCKRDEVLRQAQDILEARFGKES